MTRTEHEAARAMMDATLTRRRALGLVAGAAAALGPCRRTPGAAAAPVDALPWLATAGNRIVTAGSVQAVLLLWVNILL
jgi:hypothetical protein